MDVLDNGKGIKNLDFALAFAWNKIEKRFFYENFYAYKFSLALTCFAKF